MNSFDDDASGIGRRLDQRTLEERRWRNWLLVVGTLLVIVVGLSVSIFLVTASRPDEPQPGTGTGALLLITLLVVIALLGVRLTRQERQLAAMASRMLRAEQASLKESEARFEQMANSIREAFWITANLDSKEYVSPAYEKILGRACRVLDTGRIEWLDAVHPDDRERVKTAFFDRAARGEFAEVYRIQRPDGATRWIRDRAFPVHDRNGHVYRIAGIVEDITEQRELQDQLLRSQRIEAIGHLAGGVAHDFNNLLTVIIGRSQLLLHHLDRERLHHEAQLIRETAERAASLTRQLLVFSRGQAAEQQVFDLNEVVGRMEDMLQRLIGDHVRLVTSLGKEPGAVIADPGQVEQIVMNLAINARDAMPEGGKLIIETENVDLDAAYAKAHVAVRPGSYVRLSVSDTGCGIAREIQDRIFEPFFSTKEKDAGSGLGLSVVYGIVKTLRGNVWVYSEPGHGTTFKVYLPRAVDAALPESKETAAPEQLPDGSETILLVEDQDAVRELAREILMSCGYTVLEAEHGPRAIVLSDQYPGTIDLLVTDTVMPEMDGVELAKRLQESRPEMKRLFMSGYTENSVIHQVTPAAGRHFLQKPFTLEALARKVRTVLDAEGD
jgi:two-component system cell cycle sensor histidine kinase/response regulator CckA